MSFFEIYRRDVNLLPEHTNIFNLKRYFCLQNLLYMCLQYFTVSFYLPQTSTTDLCIGPLMNIYSSLLHLHDMPLCVCDIFFSLCTKKKRKDASHSLHYRIISRSHSFQIFEINVKSTFFLAKETVPYLQERGQVSHSQQYWQFNVCLFQYDTLLRRMPLKKRRKLNILEVGIISLCYIYC